MDTPYKEALPWVLPLFICDKNPEFGFIVLSGSKVLDPGINESTNQISAKNQIHKVLFG
jgi:hypothetical protein